MDLRVMAYFGSANLTGTTTMAASNDLQGQMSLMRMLGFGGLIPFYGLSIAVLFSQDANLRNLAFVGLSVYAVAVLAFLGAIHWGLAMATPDLAADLRKKLLMFGVLPALAGCGLFFLPGGYRLLGLALAYGAVFVFDSIHYRSLGLPQDWLRLRSQLTTGAVLALVGPGSLAIA
jgi:hypothetical protein